MSQSFQEVVAQWTAEKRQWVKESSYATYVRLVNAHLLPFFSGRQSIEESLVQQFANGTVDKKRLAARKAFFTGKMWNCRWLCIAWDDERQKRPKMTSVVPPGG